MILSALSPGSSDSARPIRLLYVTHQFSQGGLEQVVLNFARRYDRDRFRLWVAFYAGSDMVKELEGIPDVTILPLSGRSRWGKFRALYSAARRVRPDIVHNHFCWYGLLVGALVGARRVETVHNVYGWFVGVQRVAYGLSLVLAHRVIAVAEYIRSFTIGYFPFVKPAKTVVIRNGIEVYAYKRGGDGGRIRSECGVPGDAVVAGYVGRLVQQKGVGVLLSAARILAERFPSLHILIAGEGPLDPSLRATAVEYGLTKIHFLGYRRDIPAVLAACDMVLLPSFTEGLPLIVLEAMAAGLPVVATRVGGAPEAVAEGETGSLVDPGDAEQLADRIAFLCSHPEAREAMGKAAQRKVQSDFSAETMVSATESLYLSLLRTRKRRRTPDA